MFKNLVGLKPLNKQLISIEKLLCTNKILFCIVLLAAIFIFTLPAGAPLRHPGLIYSHDGEGHVVKVIQFDQALSDGEFPVRWAKGLNYGLGYPIFTFNYPVSYFMYDSIHHILGLHFVDSLKLLLYLSFPLSALFAFFWLRQHFKNTIAFLGCLVYTWVPYHFVNVYVRAALGEVIAATFIPLCFYLLEKLIQKPSLLRAGFFAFSLALLLNAHNVTALIFYPILFLYGLIRIYLDRMGKISLKSLFLLCSGFAWSLLISAFYLIPALFYQGDTRLDVLKTYFLTHDNWPNFTDLIYSPWGYGPSKAPDGMSFQIGIFHLFFFVISCLLLIVFWKKRTKNNILALFFIVSFAGGVFFMQPVSLPVWKLFSSLEYSQFPWRFLLVPSVSVAFLTCYSVEVVSRKINQKSVFYLLLLILVFNLIYSQHSFAHVFRFYQFNTKPYEGGGAIAETRAYLNEHLPKWHNSSNEVMPYTQSEVLSGSAKLTNLVWKTNFHKFLVTASESAVIADRTDYFPGWNVFENGKPVSVINPYNPKSRGLLAFQLGPGKYIIESRFSETNIEKISDIASIGGLGLIIITFFLQNNLIKIFTKK